MRLLRSRQRNEFDATTNFQRVEITDDEAGRIEQVTTRRIRRLAVLKVDRERRGEILAGFDGRFLLGEDHLRAILALDRAGSGNAGLDDDVTACVHVMDSSFHAKTRPFSKKQRHGEGQKDPVSLSA